MSLPLGLLACKVIPPGSARMRFVPPLPHVFLAVLLSRDKQRARSWPKPINSSHPFASTIRTWWNPKGNVSPPEGEAHIAQERLSPPGASGLHPPRQRHDRDCDGKWQMEDEEESEQESSGAPPPCEQLSLTPPVIHGGQ